MLLTPEQLDRAVGSVVVSAAGDALGSQYEFGPPRAEDAPVEYGVGYFGHAVGEWTDDTSMAMPLLQALARGASLTDTEPLGGVVAEWLAWSRTSKDVGAQTSSVPRGLDGVTTVAAIAGSLAGAVFGASSLPATYRTPLHGWPGLRAAELAAIATAAAREGAMSSATT